MVVRLTGKRTKKKVCAALEIEIDARRATQTLLDLLKTAIVISAALASFA